MLVAADGQRQEVAHIFWIFEKIQKMKLLEPKNVKFNENKDFWKSYVFDTP